MPGELILLVDDETHIVELAKLYLEREVFRVASVGDGQSALDRVAGEAPALMVLDLMLPVLDGYEVCRRVRARSDLPIIMLTARDEDIDKIIGLELGADDYMTKPFNPRELVARVKAILRRANRRRNASSRKPLRLSLTEIGSIILIIDEAASLVDTLTEALTQRGMARLMTGWCRCRANSIRRRSRS